MIAFIGAMETEVAEIVKKMKDVQKEEHSGFDFYLGTLSDKSCVVMKSGVGKTDSAMSTTVLLENFDVDEVINIGTAGGIHRDLEVLDVVVSTRVAHHDVDVPGWDKGFDGRSSYVADKELVNKFQRIKEDNERIWFGDIVTGDCFVMTPLQVESIEKNYPGALCAEMEGASIAQVCTHYKKPFVIVRSLSDIVYLENNEMTFEEYVQKASERSARWCEKLMSL